MAFFDKLEKTISNAADIASDKAKELGDKANIKIEIHKQETAAEKELLELGKAVYNDMKGKSDSPYADHCSKISACYDKIETLKKQYGGPEEKVPEAEPKADKPAKVCPKCGAKLDSDAGFCDQCGTAIPD